MGMLYQAVQTRNDLKNAANTALKQQFVLERLKELKVTHTKDGQSIELLSYDELKYELVMASFREIDAESEANKFF